MTKTSMPDLIALCKTRGFIFSGSEIYGGLANSWDYGPLGVELKNNVKKAFWRNFVYNRTDMVGLDAAILMNPRVWEASGHVGTFSDPLMDCKNCKNRYRADKLVEESGNERPNNWAGEKTPSSDFLCFIQEKGIKCPSCNEVNWTEPKQFNLMFKTHQGVTDDSANTVYMRPETAQGIFVNFKNVERTTRRKLPFGIAQIGKAFRNEITPGNFTFRTREFEQMEIEYFFDPEKNNWKDVYEAWKKNSWDFVTKQLGIKTDNIRFRDHDKDELSHYSKGTVDIEYEFPFGWGELCAAGAYRTDYDLNQHQSFSKQDMEYRDEESGRKFIPHVLEPSYGCDRLSLAVLLDSLEDEQLKDGSTRNVMRFLPNIAPVKVAILPLMKKDGMAEKAQEIRNMMTIFGNCQYDGAGSIGKRYRRQDEIGTPVCVTIDYDTLGNANDANPELKNTVTIRDRDTMKQERVKIEKLISILGDRYFW